jgi:dihydrolipoamide dehydrogenase
MVQVDKSANNTETKLAMGETLEISLSENPTTGFRWELKAAGDPVCAPRGDSFDPPAAGVGRSGTHRWRFEPVGKGAEQRPPETLSFEHAIIATGSRPASVPGLSIDSPRVMDSTTALDLPDIPKSLLVVGGGYIGLELGSVYAALGTKVTAVEMTGGLLPGADRDLVTFLSRRMEQTLHKVLVNARVVDMKETKGGIKVRIDASADSGAGQPALTDADKEQTFDRVLVSVGRKPNSAFGLDKTRVKVGARIHRGRRRPAHREPTSSRRRRRWRAMLAHKASTGPRRSEGIEGTMLLEPQAIPPSSLPIGSGGGPAGNGRSVRCRWKSRNSGRRRTPRHRPAEGVTKLIIEPATRGSWAGAVVGAGRANSSRRACSRGRDGGAPRTLKLSIPRTLRKPLWAAEVSWRVHVYRPGRNAKAGTSRH